VPQSLTFPATLLPVGTTILGSITLASGDDSFVVTFDRTITGGLNQTPDANNPWMFAFGVELSTDGGNTWAAIGGCACPGQSQQGPFNNLDGRFPATGNRRVRAWVTVPAGITALKIAGSVSSGVNLSAPGL
jgi:hypothetical protein